MTKTLQEFLAEAIPKAKDDLVAALMRLPEDKRDWSPMGKARTALNQAAECAILNGSVPKLLKSRTWDTAFDFAEFEKSKVDLAKDLGALKDLLENNTSLAIAAIREVPDKDLDVSVDMPWGPATLAQIAAYPYWNMCYHEGQINYIASMLGCLD